MNDLDFAKIAVYLSKESLDKGAFPAGAVLVKNGCVLSKNISAKWPKITMHGESKCIDEVMDKQNSQLSECVLYCSMEPCLMCSSRAYWAGIRKIFFVIKKQNVDAKFCYESEMDNESILNSFNEKIEIIQVKELEPEALEVYKQWVDNNSR